MIETTNTKIIFAPIAQREVDFYLALAKQLRTQNQRTEVEFISFYQNGNHTIETAGFRVWDPYKELNLVSLNPGVESKTFESFGIRNAHKLCLHEQVTFKVRDSHKLYSKFENYLTILEKFLKESLTSSPQKRVVVFQELGGFIAPMALFFVCQKLKMEHVFFEPSFFLGKMHCLQNSYFLSFEKTSKISGPKNAQVLSYLESLRQKKSLVIPAKDRHHYQDMGLSKIFNKRNIQRLLNKIYVKFFLRQKQEYEHISSQVFGAFKQYITRVKLGNCYTDEIPHSSFVYFPFHVALDFQLTIRDPEYLDQLGLVEFICSILPKGFTLVIKEHPISVGGMDARRLKGLLTRFDNLILLNPMINTYKILEEADGVITISSKVGAEAIVLGKPVACLGHGFYFNSELVNQVTSISKIEDWLLGLQKGEVKGPKPEQVDIYFSEVYRQTYPFELYNLDPENINRFKESILDLVQINETR